MNLITPMLRLITVGCLIAVAATTAHAAEKIIPGPKGGKLLENTPPRAEFFVEKDGKVVITFYDAKLKPVPVAEQSLTVVAQAKRKATLEFEKKDGALVSKTPLPEGDAYSVVVQIKAKPDAKPQNLRFRYETHACGECKRPEYACICGH